MPSTKEILEKYGRKFESEVNTEAEDFEKRESDEYVKFLGMKDSRRGCEEL